MAFLIPDNLKSRADVPHVVRNAARALELGLDDEAAVWYEPLYDPAGGRPDLVVLLPDLGIVVLEVFGGDARHLKGSVKAGPLFEQAGLEAEAEDLLRRAEHFAGVLRRRIAAEPRLQGLAVPVGSGAVLGLLNEKEALGRAAEAGLPLERCLLRQHLDAAIEGSGEAELLRVFRQILGSPSAGSMPEAARGALREVLQPPERREKLLRGLIHPGTVIDRISRPDEPAQLTIFRPPQDGEDVLRVMDRRQEALAMSLGTGHRVIRGVAGSGKTLILVYRARLLARLFPGQRFLLTCYTRSLAAQLRVLLKQHRNIEVKNLHKLMYRAIHAAGLEPPDVRDEQRLADTAIEALQRFPFQRYRAVFVDEAQDLGTEALRFALALLQEPDGDFVVVADAAQNIFRRKFSWKQAGIRAAGRTQILRQNYRNTREILGFAYRFLMAGPELRPDAAPDPEDEQAVIPPESAARSGPAPRVWIRPDLDGEVGIAVRQTIRWAQSAPGPRHVAVLYANGEEQGRALRLYRGLVDGGLEVFWANQKTADAIGEAEEPVVLASVHAAKGLEFPRVVLCGLWRQEQDAESNRRLAYVGMTRAMDHLSVLTTEDNPLASDLRSALEAEAEAPP